MFNVGNVLSVLYQGRIRASYGMTSMKRRPALWDSMHSKPACHHLYQPTCIIIMLNRNADRERDIERERPHGAITYTRVLHGVVMRE